MTMSNAAEAALLDLLFLNAAWADVGDAAGLQPSAADGDLHFALHTADPGEAGSQLTSECAYTGYARQPVARDGTGFVRTVSTMSLFADVDFPVCAGGSEVATHWSVGLELAGASVILCSGALANPLAIATGVQPRIPASTSFALAD